MLNPLTRTIITRYGKVISGDRDDFEERDGYILYKDWPWFWKTEKIYREAIAEDRQSLNAVPFVLVSFLTAVVGLAGWGVLANLSISEDTTASAENVVEESQQTPEPKQVMMVNFVENIEEPSDRYCPEKMPPTLRKGDYGDEVRLAQGLLAEYYDISLDGDFRGRTQAAVKRLQYAHGLTADGIIGPETWQLLSPNCFASI